MGKTEDQTQIKRDIVNSKMKPITHPGPEPSEIKNEKQKRKTKTLQGQIEKLQCNVQKREYGEWQRNNIEGK